ncbi:hypothetical protein L207DRAFT_606183 [Hyaloscypha variabilis F]|uniref:Clr5 domain-containing protein n=1 Tax=Hyaloscypha variabilis (strain UAMH 11265 / GT02V1 / F) TaxID=1149755 RepID=A0A2J6S8N0_HYAVF|nr:hypothetical protein L207DRAFT_606183 [Hyaloscypha variabilis F]
MPESWEYHKSVIEELYLTQRCTLEELRKIMKTKHGFTAAPRTYKLKLDEWKFHKNRRKKVGPGKDFPKQSQIQLVYVPCKVGPSPSKRPFLTTDEQGLCPATLDPPTKDSIMSESLPSSPSNNYELTSVSAQRPPITQQPKLLCRPSSTAIGWVTNDLCCPSRNLEDIIVNSSLMFFSFRPHTESLQLLAKSPEMAQWAVEIVLRNWRPGGECIQYLLHFLNNSACCRTLLLYNSIRWTDEDETMFNIIDFDVPEEQQVLTALAKAMLKADFKFRHPLPQLRPAWADQWRLAVEQTEWSLATEMVRLLVTEPCDLQLFLARLKRDRRLVYCALVVIAESLLEKNKRILVNWSGDIDIFFETARTQYFEILKDCRSWGIALDASWFADLVVVNTIIHGTSCYFTSRPANMQG